MGKSAFDPVKDKTGPRDSALLAREEAQIVAGAARGLTAAEVESGLPKLWLVDKLAGKVRLPLQSDLSRTLPPAANLGCLRCRWLTNG